MEKSTNKKTVNQKARDFLLACEQKGYDPEEFLNLDLEILKGEREKIEGFIEMEEERLTYTENQRECKQIEENIKNLYKDLENFDKKYQESEKKIGENIKETYEEMVAMVKEGFIFNNYPF
jgi:hypothetical protein